MKRAALLAVLLLSGCSFIAPRGFSSPLSWNGRDQTLFALNVGCHAYDYRQTEWALEQGDRFHEGSPLMGDRPSDEKLIAQKAAAVAAVYVWANATDDGRTAALAGLLLGCAAIVAHNHSEGARP